jgi:hypothetical protein
VSIGNGHQSIVQSLAMMLTRLLPDILILSIKGISDMEIRALCPISGSNDSRKRHEMRLISKLDTVSTPLALMNVFPMLNSVCLCLSNADVA